MKKVLVMAVASVLALSLAACSSSSVASDAGSTAQSSSTAASDAGNGIKDGVYSAEFTEASHGWKDTLSVTYTGGKVTDAKYDAVNDKNELKSEQSQENYDMDPPLTEWMPKLNENIIAAGTADSIEAVAGATSSSNNAKLLMAAVEEAAKKGDTTTVKVELPKAE